MARSRATKTQAALLQDQAVELLGLGETQTALDTVRNMVEAMRASDHFDPEEFDLLASPEPPPGWPEFRKSAMQARAEPADLAN